MKISPEMRHSVLAFSSIVILLANMQLHCSTAAASSKPNIIFVLTDDQGWTSSSVQMNPGIPNSISDYYETPNLQKLAAQGMRFSDAYSPAPICSASRAAIFTGKSPAQVHFTELISSTFPTGGQYQSYYLGKPLSSPIPIPMLPESTTIAERLHENAPEYTTALLGKDHVGSHPRQYGFDVYDFHMFGYEPEGKDPKKVFSTANRANAFMEQQVQNDAPFFLEISTLAPHAPYEYRDETFAYFNGKPRGARHSSAAFASSLYDFDAALGMVLDKVDELGIADNTYVIFTSDNGATAAPRSNEPLTGAKGTLWEGGIRVPMIVRGPGVAAGSVSNVPVVATDVFATVSELAGVTAPHDELSESASLVPLLHNGGQLPEGESLSRAFGPNGELFFHFPHYSGGTTPVSAVRDGDYKLMKFYGSLGQPDEFALFNLKSSVTESTSLSSPLNLASQMPTKVAELQGKLEAWLVGVDASLAKRPEENIELLWDGAAQGKYPSLWRSTIEVDDLRRESWDVIPPSYVAEGPPANQITRQKAVNAFQPGLSSAAFAFDGNDVMRRPYFQVSDPSRPEVDGKGHSASFEFWVRFDDLNRSQVIFESGDGQKGISLTLGDVNGDGVFSEARFRVLGQNGQQLTSTARIDQFADPTQDFVQVTAVVSDKDDDRFVALYVNGALFARTSGIVGTEGRLDWDGLDDAALGGLGGNGIGASGGTGQLPFSGNMVGEISRMRFNNYALAGADVFQNYAQVLDPVNYGIAGAAGHASTPGSRFRTIAAGVAESALVRVMQERTDSLDAPLAVDGVIQGGETFTQSNAAAPGTITLGTEVISYIMHFDPVGADGALQKHVAGSVVFENDILGIILGDGALAATDAVLGSIGVYGATNGRGTVLTGGDFISISADRRTLSFDWSIMGDDLAQLRVVTSAPIAGDFNGDGVANYDDLELWKASFGKNSFGDADFDGDSDGADFLAWQRQFGATSSSVAQAATPEPHAGFMLLVGVAAGMLVWRRQTLPTSCCVSVI